MSNLGSNIKTDFFFFFFLKEEELGSHVCNMYIHIYILKLKNRTKEIAISSGCCREVTVHVQVKRLNEVICPTKFLTEEIAISSGCCREVTVHVQDVQQKF